MPVNNDVSVIAIDGRCASGKTTLAKLLKEALNAPIISMDDFFLPPELRTKERLSSPGGNIHYERFTEEVAKKIKHREAFSYRRFDCHRMEYAEPVLIPSSSVRIVEGSYSLRPEWRSLYDQCFFLTVSSATQEMRIKNRNGADALKHFQSHWIPMEEAYIKAHEEFFNHLLTLTLRTTELS